MSCVALDQLHWFGLSKSGYVRLGSVDEIQRHMGEKSELCCVRSVALD